jgi:hypothetical protein
VLQRLAIILFLANCFGHFCSTILAQSELPRSSYSNLDLFETAERVEPEFTERPKASKIILPDSLNDLTVANSRPNAELSDWLRWLVLKNLPPTYEDNRKWGLQKSVYDGFRFRREGIKLETERKYKNVKHGTWSRYFLEFDDPERRLKLDVKRFETTVDRMRIDVEIEAPLHAFGRMSQWQRDIQMISLSMNADVMVRLTVESEVAIRINPLVFPPVIQLEPVVKKATVALTQFEVHRISQLHGPLAEQLGKGIRGVVDDRLADYSDKLIVKMNQQLEKQKDKLKLSLGQKLPGWLPAGK